MHRRRFLATLGGLAAAACSRVPPLVSTHASPALLATAVLDALARRDRTALVALALDETEFRDHVWPQLPASRPERKLPFSYVWGDLRQKSSESLSRTLASHGGRRYELVEVRFEAVTDYDSYRVHRRSVFRVKGDSGTSDLQLCGSMIEKGGAWKVFSYVVND